GEVQNSDRIVLIKTRNIKPLALAQLLGADSHDFHYGRPPFVVTLRRDVELALSLGSLFQSASGRIRSIPYETRPVYRRVRMCAHQKKRVAPVSSWREASPGGNCRSKQAKR